jgi:Rieske 2Fe-2S family protein
MKGVKTLPGHYYKSEEIFSEEIERIFYSRWVCVGQVEQIPKPGDYFTAAVGDESLIIVRDFNGEVRAFYNVCRHRGTRLCTSKEGHFSKDILCPYHAWSYNLDGQLKVAPLMNEVEGFNREDYPLKAVAIATWEGFLFLNLSSSPEPFETAFAPLIDRFSPWQMHTLRVAARIEYDIAANWKLIHENYSECYHCPTIHPELAKMSPYRSGENDLFSGPFLGGFMTMNHTGGSMTKSGNLCSPPLGEVSGENLNRVYYYSIFPNMLLGLHPDFVMVHRLYPQSPSRTYIVCEWLFDSEAIVQPGFDPSDAVDFWDLTNRQDWEICELTQLGVTSRSYTPCLYAGAESLLAAFDEEVLKVLGHSSPV